MINVYHGSWCHDEFPRIHSHKTSWGILKSTSDVWYFMCFGFTKIFWTSLYWNSQLTISKLLNSVIILTGTKNMLMFSGSISYNHQWPEHISMTAFSALSSVFLKWLSTELTIEIIFEPFMEQSANVSYDIILISMTFIFIARMRCQLPLNQSKPCTFLVTNFCDNSTRST